MGTGSAGTPGVGSGPATNTQLGARIPIDAESAVHGSDPEYLVVLPWHFREGILALEAGYLRRGVRVVFPLPEIEVLGD